MVDYIKLKLDRRSLPSLHEIIEVVIGSKMNEEYDLRETPTNSIYVINEHHFLSSFHIHYMITHSFDHVFISYHTLNSSYSMLLAVCHI